MSKQETIKVLKAKINQLNKKIDLCIITEKPYKKLSEEHLKIFKALNAIERK